MVVKETSFFLLFKKKNRTNNGKPRAKPYKQIWHPIGGSLKIINYFL